MVILRINTKPSQQALARPLQKRLLLPIGCIHRYHAVGGANDTTMVVMFVGLLCWC